MIRWSTNSLYPGFVILQVHDGKAWFSSYVRPKRVYHELARLTKSLLKKPEGRDPFRNELGFDLGGES